MKHVIEYFEFQGTSGWTKIEKYINSINVAMVMIANAKFTSESFDLLPILY